MMKVVRNYSWDATILQIKEMPNPGQAFCLLMGLVDLVDFRNVRENQGDLKQEKSIS